MSEARHVYIVDDNEAIRRSTGFLLNASGYSVRTFQNGFEFLSQRNLPTGCVLLDLQMPGLDGLEVQREMRERGQVMPIVVLTGHGDIHAAVQAMKGGAVDFIEKPYDQDFLLRAVEEAFSRLKRSDQIDVLATEARDRLNCLSQRELEVLCGLVRGYPNKTIAYDLNISARTVEVHRANLMTKLGVNSLSEVLRIAFSAGIGVQDGGGETS